MYLTIWIIIVLIIIFSIFHQWESPKVRDHWEDQGVVEKMGSEWILG
jgi:hypothetical protein